MHYPIRAHTLSLSLSLSLTYVLWACKSLSGNRKKNKRIHKQEDKERDNKRIYVPIADAGPQQMSSANPLKLQNNTVESGIVWAFALWARGSSWTL